MRILLRLYQATAAGMLAACSDGSGPAFTKCHQTGEFANFGCARVEGVARDAAGNPLAGVQVALSAAQGPNSFDTPTQVTNASGSYSLEIHDYGGPQQVSPPPDPVTLTLSGTLLNDDPTMPPIHNSVDVIVKFAPVGEVPEVAQADIALDLQQAITRP